jgi:outer membrane receptor protein involved in Fe transport
MAANSRRPPVPLATAVSRTLRALPLCATATLLHAPATPAQDVEHTVLAADIPAQPLARALQTFARNTGLQLVYVSGVVQGQKSHAASAGLSASEAIARMLQGTGLKFDFLTARSIRIFAAAAANSREGSPNTSAGEGLQELIVTANRREQMLQNVPMAVQVLTGDTLARLNATTFDDFTRYLPGVTAHGVGPGESNIYMRGLATAVFGINGSGWSGGFPNVAVYLDEQSVQLPGRNLDLYAVDLDRIEVLEGPQGTLFGAGAQAGQHIRRGVAAQDTVHTRIPRIGVGDAGADLAALEQLAFHAGPRVQPRSRGGCEQGLHIPRSCRLAEHHDFRRVAAERGDVVVHPP